MGKEDHNVYVKKGRRYEPIGYWFEGRNDWLTEGVWVVCQHEHSRGTTNGQYLKECYGIDKMSDLTKINFSELGGLEKIADEITSHLSYEEVMNNKSLYEVVRRILGEAYKIGKNDTQNI